jgi:hypothetical protein
MPFSKTMPDSTPSDPPLDIDLSGLVHGWDGPPEICAACGEAIDDEDPDDERQVPLQLFQLDGKKVLGMLSFHWPCARLRMGQAGTQSFAE